MQRMTYQKKRKRRNRWRKSALIGLSLMTAAVTAFISLRLYAQITGAPSLSVPKATIFLDRNGNEIGDRFAAERRYWVSLDEISPFLVDAIIAVEDKDFYEHNGFDYSRIASALLKDIKAFRKVEGASTISQQYARNLYLSLDKTWTRKVNEALIAYRMEVFYDKDVILEGYLNTVYFGHGMYGVEAASKFFFGKSAKDLTLAESALLAGIPKGPSIYSPVESMENATNRQKVILSLMENQNYISSEQREHAKAEQIVLKHEEWRNTKLVAPYFLDEVWKEAEKILTDKGRLLAEGGWTIQTTLNVHHQKVAEESIQRWMPDNDLQVGFIAMEPDTGYVTAMVGGREYAESPFNRATQAKRQSGSAMKPILYAAAIEEGFSPLTYLRSEETVFTYDGGRATYEPSNVNGKFAHRPISLAQALAISDNIYAVKTLEEIGYGPFRDVTKRFGVDAKILDTPAMALGTSEVTLEDMTNAYNIIAARGEKTEPVMILSIKDEDGRDVYIRKEGKRKRALLEEDAFILTHLMTGMFDPVFNDYTPATGLSMRAKQTRPYAAKSGTTLSDQYLIGFSPSLTAGIWTGYDVGKQLTEATDKQATKQIWIEFMEKALSGQPAEPFLPPKGVTGVIVDVETGGIAVSACEKKRLIYVKDKDIPDKLCTDPALQAERSSGDKDEGFQLFPFSFFD